jgi:hypothetical protein
MHKIKKRYVLLLILLALVIYGCASEYFGRDSYYELVTLPSGKSVRILNIGKAYGANTNDPPMLILNYETDLSIKDHQNLEQEAQEIWEVFKINADKEGMVSAAVRANEKRKGFLFHWGSAYGFVYTKSDQGIWQPYKPKN